MSCPTHCPNCSNEQEDIFDDGKLSPESNYDSTEDVSSSISKHIEVFHLYLSHISKDDHEGILITAVEREMIAENRISLKYNHLNTFGLLQLLFKGSGFFGYFPPDATIEVSKILLQKSNIKHNKFSLENLDNDCWDPIHIITKNENDCNYLFTKAIEDKYTVVLAIQFEIVDANNSLQVIIYPNSKNGTPLHRATFEGDIKIIETLLDYKININDETECGWTPLLMAVHSEMSDVVDFLISNGADVNVYNNQYIRPLHYAAEGHNTKILNSLLKSQAKIHKKDHFYRTPLHFAVNAGNIDAVDILLKKGANYRFEDKGHCTPFHDAIENLNLNILEVFLKYNVDVHFLNTHGQTPIFYISKERYRHLPKDVDKETYSKIIYALVQKGANINFQDSKGHTPLHYAVINDNVECVQALLECNADASIRDKLDNNLFHLAGRHEANRCIPALSNINIDINAVDVKGKTAVHVAVDKHNYNAVEVILKKNPNMYKRDEHGKTALHLALESYSLSIVELLLENKADVNLNDSSGRIALHSASMNHRITINIIKCILNLTNDINAVDKDLISPLHLACFAKNAEVVKYLIENGADSSMQDKDGKTVFHYACMPGSHVDYLKEYAENTLNVLIEENISVNCVDKFGKTPLHYAAKNNNLFFVTELLLNIGADINIVDKDYNLPFDNSYKRDFDEDDESKKLFTIYKHHIVKMQVMKLWVREKILDKIYNLNNEYHLDWIQHYERVCIEEIDLMKKTHLDQNNITFYDFLKKSPHDAMNYARNQNVVKAIRSNELMTMFPIYGHFLENHLRDSQRRSNLYDQIQESLKPYIFTKLPTFCMYEVLRYLDHSELHILLEAMKPIVLGKK